MSCQRGLNCNNCNNCNRLSWRACISVCILLSYRNFGFCRQKRCIFCASSCARWTRRRHPRVPVQQAHCRTLSLPAARPLQGFASWSTLSQYRNFTPCRWAARAGNTAEATAGLQYWDTFLVSRPMRTGSSLGIWGGIVVPQLSWNFVMMFLVFVGG